MNEYPMTHIARLASTDSGFIAYDYSGAVVGYGRSALEIIGRMYGDGWREAETMTQRRVHGGWSHHKAHKVSGWDSNVTAYMARNIQARNARKRA